MAVAAEVTAAVVVAAAIAIVTYSHHAPCSTASIAVSNSNNNSIKAPSATATTPASKHRQQESIDSGSTYILAQKAHMSDCLGRSGGRRRARANTRNI